MANLDTPWRQESIHPVPEAGADRPVTPETRPETAPKADPGDLPAAGADVTLVVAGEPLGESLGEPLGEPLGKAVGRPWLAALLSWLLPGLGHVYLGRRRRGLAFGLLVGLLIWMGVLFRGPLWGYEFMSVRLGSELLALPLVFLKLTGYQGIVTYLGYEYGLTYLLTAALFSLLLMFDAWDLSRGYKP